VARGDMAARVGERVRGSRESQQLGNDLDELVDRLGMLLETQRQFAVDAAHELRSPIATIRGEIQLALRRGRSAEAYREMLEELLGDVEALARLAEDLLALSRNEVAIEAREESSTREIVDDALWMARGLAGERGATFHVVESSPGASAARVRGARGELARVVRNLLDNAIRYGTRGDHAVRVELFADGEHVEVAVVDHGPGVSPSERDAIFAAFHRGEQGLTARRDGAGLGLFIAREIARAHRGDVIIDPEVADGARFVLTLRRTPEAA
jgi:two-component system OmpR family sensor kinase